MNFVKKIFNNQIDDSVHRQFIKFGKGEYKNRFILSLWKTKKIKVKTSFEFANDLVKLCSEFGDCKVSGITLSKKNISEIMSQNNIKINSKAKRGGLYYQNEIESQELNKSQLQELEKESYSTLLDLEGEFFNLKIKKKLPKPGKNEAKIDDKFCKLEVDNKFSSQIREDLFWDVKDAKKININHAIIINEIVAPEGEKDFAKIREMGKRKGKIIRKIDVDGKESENEREIEV